MCLSKKIIYFEHIMFLIFCKYYSDNKYRRYRLYIYNGFGVINDVD